MSFSSIRSLISAKLDTVSNLQFVDDKHSMELTGFPAATFEPSNNENVFFTNAENMRSYAFDIVIHQEMTKAGRDSAINILCSTVDAVITAFDTDYNLSGNVDFCQALPSKWGEYTNGSSTVKWAMLTIVCVKTAQVVS